MASLWIGGLPRAPVPQQICDLCGAFRGGPSCQSQEKLTLISHLFISVITEGVDLGTCLQLVFLLILACFLHQLTCFPELLFYLPLKKCLLCLSILLKICLKGCGKQKPLESLEFYFSIKTIS